MNATSRDSVSVKVQFGEDIRRFALDSLSYANLVQQLTKCYQLPSSTALVVRYRDDEKDWISMSSDQELGFAATFGNPIMLAITESSVVGQPAMENSDGPRGGHHRCERRRHRHCPPRHCGSFGGPVCSEQDELKRKELKEARREAWRAWREAKGEGFRRHGGGCFDVPERKGEGFRRHGVRLVSDVTVPDQIRFHSGETFLKVWKLRNESSVAWPANLQLVFRRGSQMTSATSIALGKAVLPNEEIELSVPMVAPLIPGDHLCVWRMSADQDGNQCFFGRPLKVKIAVYPASQLAQ